MSKIIIFIIFIIILSIILFLRHKYCFFNIKKNPWINSCKSYSVYTKDSKKYLEADLLYTENDLEEKVRKNKIRLLPLFNNCILDNDGGYLKYKPTSEEDSYITNKLFPKYNGKTIDKLKINECVMLSVDIDKYNKTREETINILKQYKFPNISTHFGYTPSTVINSTFLKYMNYNSKKIKNRQDRDALVCGMLEVFDNFANKSNDNEWLLFVEDDVRIVNVDKNQNLNFLYNVPVDAELIRPYTGSYSKCELENIKYKQSYGGVLNHAFYISRNGCKKAVNYAKKYGWQFSCDIDLYWISKFNKEVMSGIDGWWLWSIDGICDTIKLESEKEKIIMYHMDHVIFSQTSDTSAIPKP